MSKENSAGLGVYNVYGPRKTAEGRAGIHNRGGDVREAVIHFTHDTASVVNLVLPANISISEIYCELEEALTGATDLDVGTLGTAATNGADFDHTSTSLQKGTLAGTWASVLTSETFVQVLVTGTATAGKGKIVIKYVNL